MACAASGEPAIYLTGEAHHGFNKIAHMCRDSDGGICVSIATDCGLKMNVEELKARVAEDRENGLLPFMVIGSAGTTAAGVIDPLPEIAEILQ